MSLRSRLLLAQAPLAFALLLVGLSAIFTVVELGTHPTVLLEDNYRSALAAQRMKESIERIDSAALFLLAGEKARADQQIALHRPQFEAELKVEEGNITEQGEREAAHALRSAWHTFEDSLEHYQALSSREEQKAYYFATLQPAFLTVKWHADAVLLLNQDAMSHKRDRGQQQAGRVSALTIVASLAAVIAGLFVQSALTVRLLRPLQVLTQASRRIGEGDLGARAMVHGKDEIAALATEFNAMADRLERYRQSSLGQLLQAQLASQSAIDALPDPVLIFDLEGRLQNVNRATESLLSVRVQTDLDALAPPLADRLTQILRHVTEGRGSYVPKGLEEALAMSLAEGERVFLPRAEPVSEDGRGLEAITVIFQDVTRLRRLDELKNDLIATVAHEFRTPLTSLHMAIHLCLEQLAGPLTEKQETLLEAARDDCQRLRSTVDDLLDLTRIQSGRITMAQQDCNLETLLREVMDAHRGAAKEKGLELTQVGLWPSCDVRVDLERIKLVFANLLTNAIRHTPPGGKVSLSARREGEHVRLEVADTGEGIPAAHLPYLFDRFYRVPGRSGGGAGLGLSIAKEIVAAHGGQMGAESVPEKGSTFWCTLKVAPLEVDSRGVS